MPDQEGIGVVPNPENLPPPPPVQVGENPNQNEPEIQGEGGDEESSGGEVTWSGPMLSGLVALPFARTSMPLDDGEREALSEAVARVLAKRMPSGAGRFGDELTLAATLGIVISRRIGRGAKREEGGRTADIRSEGDWKNNPGSGDSGEAETDYSARSYG